MIRMMNKECKEMFDVTDYNNLVTSLFRGKKTIASNEGDKYWETLNRLKEKGYISCEVLFNYTLFYKT